MFRFLLTHLILFQYVITCKVQKCSSDNPSGLSFMHLVSQLMCLKNFKFRACLGIFIPCIVVYLIYFLTAGLPKLYVNLKSINKLKFISAEILLTQPFEAALYDEEVSLIPM